MEALEVRKTRLDIVFKLVYAFLAALCALILHLGQGTPANFLYGNLLLLGIAAFLIILLFSMVRYIFFELSSFKTVSVEVEDEKKKAKKVEFVYGDMFICFSIGGGGMLFYAILYVALLMCCPNWANYINPCSTSETIFFVLSCFLSILPYEFDLPVAWSYRKCSQCCKAEGCVKVGEKRTEIHVNLQKIKCFQWVSWSVFVYHLLYLGWFV